MTQTLRTPSRASWLAACAAALTLSTLSARADEAPPGLPPLDDVAPSASTAPTEDQATPAPAETTPGTAAPSPEGRRRGCAFRGHHGRSARPMARVARNAAIAGATAALATGAVGLLGAGITTAVLVPACIQDPAACRARLSTPVRSPTIGAPGGTQTSLSPR